MFDMHYDLLTILYYINNKMIPEKRDIMIQKINSIYSQRNIIGGIINLYFMSEKEMLDELKISKNEYSDLYYMMEKSLSFFHEFKEKMNFKTYFYYSIEGLDYLDKIEDLDKLKKLGLKSVLIVWNNENKFAGGIRSNKGLTNEGIKLIEKLIELDIIIDLSHSNEKTIIDIINLLEGKKNFKIMCSHSNCFEICNNKRNLKDYQIKLLNKVGCQFGLVTYKPFISDIKLNQKEYELLFLRHIEYLLNLGVKLENISISTDDMSFMDDDKYTHNSLFELDTFVENITILLSKKYTKKQIKMFLYQNSFNFLNK